MMKTHRISRLRSLGGAAALIVVAGAGLAVAAPSVAHPHPEGDARKQHRIVIMEHKAGDRPASGEMRQFRIRHGENGEVVLPERCQNGEALANIDEQSGDQRTRVILCSDGQADAATRVQRLREARARIAANTDMRERERVLAAIDRAIAEAERR